MNVIAYLTYQLFNVDGAGHQPYHQVAQSGMEFEGGIYRRGERYLGYIIGDATLVADTMEALKTWGAVELTASEAMYWAEQATPVNTMNKDGDYIGSAEIDGEGRIARPTAGTAWSPSPRVVTSPKIDALASFMEELPVLQDALDYIDGIPDMKATKVVLKKMCRAIYAIFYYTGMSED